MIYTQWADGLQPLPTSFEAQVARSPEAVALDAGGRTETYRELDGTANRIARLLRTHDVGPEDVVGLALHRSPGLVASVLGVLKTGAAYLPLDPGYPPARLRRMLDDASPRLVLADTASTDVVKDHNGIVVPLDAPDVARRLGALPAAPLRGEERPDPLLPGHPAYVIYTSGSTGRPKGVVVHAGAVANLIRWQHRMIPGGVGVRTAQFTTISFDVSVLEILTALCYGKTLCLPTVELQQSAELFAAWIEEHGVNELYAPNTFITGLVEAAAEYGHDLGSLTYLTQAGEPLSAPVVRRLREAYPKVCVQNHYGPSETHCATVYVVPDDLQSVASPVQIGAAIDGVSVYVLDERMEQVAPGLPGELYIGGAGVGRGYLGQPELTAERFVADPFGPPGTRMYRTGDVARRNDQGELCFIGRVDNQVKIRGMRVEPAEVEAVLVEHPAVREAAVTAVTTSRGDIQLVGYVTTLAGDGVPESLRSFAGDQLPRHMVPTAWVHLDAMPLTPNGKLDRLSLPTAQLPPRPGRPAATPQEAYVATLACRLLGRESIDADDDFFDIGGHSLFITRLLSRIKADTGVRIKPVTVYDGPTVAAVAEALTLSQDAGKGDFPRIGSRPGDGRHRDPDTVTHQLGGMMQPLAPSDPHQSPDPLGRRFCVLVNAEGQHCLWPHPVAVPAGWTVARSADTRDACLQFVAHEWTDLRPRSLALAQAARAAGDAPLGQRASRPTARAEA